MQYIKYLPIAFHFKRYVFLIYVLRRLELSGYCHWYTDIQPTALCTRTPVQMSQVVWKCILCGPHAELSLLIMQLTLSVNICNFSKYEHKLLVFSNELLALTYGSKKDNVSW